jgi:HAD superfamily hydrolase (TIGR01509 family)
VADPGRPEPPDVTDLGRSIEAITLDFGNTLVPFTGPLMRNVVRVVAERAQEAWRFPADEFVRLWGEERLRQLAEDVPEGREADMAPRAARVLARLRGLLAPPVGLAWDDDAVAELSNEREIEILLDSYASAFVELTPVPPEIDPLLEELARGRILAILSNWPLASAVDRFVMNAGWSRHLAAVVVSQRVGVIKPWPAIFQAAARELGVTSGHRFLHVGDDLGADVGGAHGVGWRAAWVRARPGDQPVDSPLPVAPVSGEERPDITIERVTDLPRALGLRRRRSP